MSHFHDTDLLGRPGKGVSVNGLFMAMLQRLGGVFKVAELLPENLNTWQEADECTVEAKFDDGTRTWVVVLKGNPPHIENPPDSEIPEWFRQRAEDEVRAKVVIGAASPPAWELAMTGNPKKDSTLGRHFNTGFVNGWDLKDPDLPQASKPAQRAYVIGHKAGTTAKAAFVDGVDLEAAAEAKASQEDDSEPES